MMQVCTELFLIIKTINNNWLNIQCLQGTLAWSKGWSFSFRGGWIIGEYWKVLNTSPVNESLKPKTYCLCWSPPPKEQKLCITNWYTFFINNYVSAMYQQDKQTTYFDNHKGLNVLCRTLQWWKIITQVTKTINTLLILNMNFGDFLLQFITEYI